MPKGNSNRNFGIQILSDELLMGRTAAREVGKILRHYTKNRNTEVMTTFAAAPSQNTFLRQLVREKGVDWKKITAFHLDEYLDLPKGHPNTFQAYLKENIFDKIPIPQNNVHYIKNSEGTPKEISIEYERLLKKAFLKKQKTKGLYLAFIGVGVNGHIAFNEPGTDLWTENWVTQVKINKISVRQQFDDYKNHPNPSVRYKTLEEVPKNAITMTCAGILAADAIFCMVPGKQKASAVKKLVEGSISDRLPASLLRLHENVNLYLDNDSASKLNYKLKPNLEKLQHSKNLHQRGKYCY